MLSSAGGLRDWLAGRGLVAAGTPVTAAHLTDARTLRTALRAAMGAPDPSGPDPATPETDLHSLAARFPLGVRVDPSGPVLAPTRGGVNGALATVLAAAAHAGCTRQWQRLRACEAADCRWIFYDTSRNHSRHWCTMGVCGNRSKTRAYRQRQRG